MSRPSPHISASIVPCSSLWFINDARLISIGVRQPGIRGILRLPADKNRRVCSSMHRQRFVFPASCVRLNRRLDRHRSDKWTRLPSSLSSLWCWRSAAADSSTEGAEPDSLFPSVGQSRSTTLKRELLIFKSPLYSMNPSVRNLFMKTFTRDGSYRPLRPGLLETPGSAR